VSSKKRRKYSAEFKSESVKLVLEQGVKQAQAARDLGIPESVLGRWVSRARQQQRPGAPTTSESEEIRRLRKEVKILRTERDILKKATAIFAKETL